MYCEGMFGKPADKIRPKSSIVWMAPGVNGTHLHTLCQQI